MKTARHDERKATSEHPRVGRLLGLLGTIVVAIASVGALGGCIDVGTAPSDGCVPGRVEQCYCSATIAGTQECTKEQDWSPCSCPGDDVAGPSDVQSTSDWQDSPDVQDSTDVPESTDAGSECTGCPGEPDPAAERQGVCEELLQICDYETCSWTEPDPVDAGIDGYEQEEHSCDDADNDCDGQTDEGCDVDADGYCDTRMAWDGEATACPNGSGDCDDLRDWVHPDAYELLGNAIDDNCDGSTDEGLGCVGGMCSCGDTTCPRLEDYLVSCNETDACEYHAIDSTGWHIRDVWVWLPPATVSIGADPVDEANFDIESEGPVRSVVVVEGLFVMKYEVTVEIFEACEADGACEPPRSPPQWDGKDWGLNRSANDRDDHPQNGLDWSNARRVCEWLAPGGRLPSEAEWEYGASGPDHYTYPWGDNPPPSCTLAILDHQESGDGLPWGCLPCGSDGCSGTQPVGSVPDGASFFGLLDMAGNVREWTMDCWHDSYTGAPSSGAAWVYNCDGDRRPMRGGSFRDTAAFVRGAARFAENGATDQTSAAHGVRCARPLITSDF